MKQCPTCSATYDDNMSFCLNDGATLKAQSEADIPATVMFNPKPTGRIDEPAPTMLGTPPPQFGGQQQQQFGGQQPQFGAPQFEQPSWSAQPEKKKSYVGIIALVVVLFFGFLALVGGLGLFFYLKTDEPNHTVINVANSSNVANTSKKTSSYSQETGQGSPKNGFKQIAVEDVTDKNFFPDANKTSTATYADGSARVVSFLSVYDTPADAEAAFKKHLDQVNSEGKEITKRQGNYAYYEKGSSYATAFWVENRLYEFNSNDEQTLYRFAK